MSASCTIFIHKLSMLALSTRMVHYDFLFPIHPFPPYAIVHHYLFGWSKQDGWVHQNPVEHTHGGSIIPAIADTFIHYIF